MTDMTFDNVHSVGGSSLGAASQEEIKNTSSLFSPQYIMKPDLELSEVGEKIGSAVSYNFSSFLDTDKTTKYSADFETANFVGGALSVQPLFGRFIVANTDSAESPGVFRADGKNSQMYSSSSSTTLGSTSIDTVSGYEMNTLATEFPSSFFTPVKNWVFRLFTLLTDRRMVYIALVEGILILIGREANRRNNKKNLSQQISERDIGTIIIDNQEIENEILRRR
jgi:hypothetical protein